MMLVYFSTRYAGTLVMLTNLLIRRPSQAQNEQNAWALQCAPKCMFAGLGQMTCQGLHQPAGNAAGKHVSEQALLPLVWQPE